MRRWVVIDKLRHAMTENERKTWGKLNTERGSVTSTSGLV